MVKAVHKEKEGQQTVRVVLHFVEEQEKQSTEKQSTEMHHTEK